MTLDVVAPVAGRVVALADVPDEVFASGTTGPGLAIVPDGEAGVLDVVAPCAGLLASAKPHALVVEAGSFGVLVHLGVDTVTLHGRGSELLVVGGTTVEAGQLLTRWEVGVAAAAGLPLVTPVVVFELSELDVTPLVPLGHVVAAGDPLFRAKR